MSPGMSVLITEMWYMETEESATTTGNVFYESNLMKRFFYAYSIFVINKICGSVEKV